MVKGSIERIHKLHDLLQLYNEEDYNQLYNYFLNNSESCYISKYNIVVNVQEDKTRLLFIYDITDNSLVYHDEFNEDQYHGFIKYRIVHSLNEYDTHIKYKILENKYDPKYIAMEELLNHKLKKVQDMCEHNKDDKLAVNVDNDGNVTCVVCKRLIGTLDKGEILNLI